MSPSARTNRRPGLRAAAALALAMSLLAAGAAPVAADHLPVDSNPDIVGPEIGAFAITPTSVDVRTSNATIAATARLTDDKSGVNRVDVTYRSPSGAQSVSFSFFPTSRTAGDAHVGDYGTSTLIDTNRESGTWTVSSALTRDVVGNTRGYTAAQALALGAADFTVLSNRDATPPRILAVRISPSVLDLSSGDGFANVEFDAVDEGGSGAFHAIITMISPSGRMRVNAQGVNSGAPSDAITLVGRTNTSTFMGTGNAGDNGMPQYSEPGVYTVQSVQIIDRAGNSTFYTGTTLAAILPAGNFFEVRADPHDATPPTLEAFRFSPHGLDVSTSPATVNIEFDVSDDLAGVQAAWLTFRSPTIVGASPPFIQRTGSYFQSLSAPRVLDGTLRASIIFPTYDRGGDWTVTQVCVVDEVKHQTCYSGTTLGPLGPTTITVVANEPPTVRVTGVTDGATYTTAPTPGCDVRDREDGVQTGVTPSVTGPLAGVFTVTCSYTDTGGKTGTHTVTYTVTGPTNTAPNASAGGPYSGTEGAAIALDGTATDDQGDALTLAWTYTAGADVDSGATCSFDDPTVGDPGFTCTDNGTYTVTLTADDGSTDGPTTVSASVTVSNVAPTVGVLALTGNTGAACLSGNVLTLDFAWTDPGSADAPFSYAVAWGDGTTTAATDVATMSASGLTHTYAAGGPYTVTVTVTDKDGGESPIRSSSTSLSFLYSSSGILQPINVTGSPSSFKIGNTIPVKVRITDCHGVAVSGLTLTVRLQKLDSSANSVNEVTETSVPDVGNTMRYSSDDLLYIYNLSTKRSPLANGGDLTKGTYRVTIEGPIVSTTASFDMR